MRYISFYDEFALHNRNGNVRHKFWQGELIVGDPTTKTGTGNAIDTAANATDPGLELMPLVPAGATRDIICGMGVLNAVATAIAPGDTSVAAIVGKTYVVTIGTVTYKTVAYTVGQTFVADGTVTAATGDTAAARFVDLDPVITQGQYYESPYLSVGATSVPALRGLVYKVLNGTVTYNGIAYTVMQEFTTNGTVTATTGTTGAKFAITIPPAMKAREMDNRDAMFREKHLLTGNEATGYHSWTALGGFLPKDDLSNPLNPSDTTIGTNTGFGYIDN